MAALSKIQRNLQKDVSLPYNCYEVGHTWTPYCSEAAVEVGVYCLGESLKIYTPLYLLSLVFQRKWTLNALFKTFESILISSCFLSFNAFAFIGSLCSVRRFMGKFSFLHCSYIPGLLANLLAIMIERPSRRPALALYCMNMATETLYRMAIDRKLFTPVRNGEVMLFSAVMASFLYIIRKKGFYYDFVSAGLKFLLGPEEAKQKIKKVKARPSGNGSCSNGYASIPPIGEPPNQMSVSQKLSNFLKFASDLSQSARSALSRLNPLRDISWPRHTSCPHSHSCLNYVLKGFLRPFLMGYASSVVLGLVSARTKLLRNFRVIYKVLRNPMSLRFALFLGGFAGIFKFVSCLLRWTRGRDSEVHAIPAGLLAGLTMGLAPNSSVVLYLAWKLLELLFQLSVEQGLLPSISGASIVLYSISTAVLFYAAVLEPHNLKPTYRKFLNRISANRLDEINRHVLDIFGVHSSQLYHGFWPELDMSHTSRSFQETVLIWMIH